MQPITVAFVPFCLFEAVLGPDYYLGRLLLDSGNQGNSARLGGRLARSRALCGLGIGRADGGDAGV